MADTNAQHTPGPWSIREGEIWGDNDFIGIVLRTEAWTSGEPVHTQDEANARLIAAAPDLLDALNGLLGLLQLVGSRDDMPPAIGKAMAANHQVWAAHAAIARAEGGAP